MTLGELTLLWMGGPVDLGLTIICPGQAYGPWVEWGPVDQERLWLWSVLGLTMLLGELALLRMGGPVNLGLTICLS